MTKIIGLTGGIGSGKSTAAKFFNSLGIQSIDADDVAREVVQPGESCLEAVVKAFGTDFLMPDGTLNRRRLREEIFSSDIKRKALEEITHPAIRSRLAKHLDNMTGPYAILVHPLLFEKQQTSLCDFTIALSVTPESQILRAVARDRSSHLQVQRIINTQLTNSERCARADFILENTGTSNELNDKVITLHKKLLDILDPK